jgi:membrane protein YdbS with pleckstrin-like domain
MYELAHFFDATSLPLPFGLSSLLVLVVTGGSGLLAARLRYRYWRFALRSEELSLQYGVITRVDMIVPLRRIQHLDVSQNIFEREWDLGRLVVYTAGTKQNSVVIPGLPIDRAREMRDVIKQYVLEHEE